MRKNYDFSQSVKNPYSKHLKKQISLRVEIGTPLPRRINAYSLAGQVNLHFKTQKSNITSPIFAISGNIGIEISNCPTLKSVVIMKKTKHIMV